MAAKEIIIREFIYSPFRIDTMEFCRTSKKYRDKIILIKAPYEFTVYNCFNFFTSPN